MMNFVFKQERIVSPRVYQRGWWGIKTATNSFCTSPMLPNSTRLRSIPTARSQNIFVCIMLETAEAMENIEEICTASAEIGRDLPRSVPSRASTRCASARWTCQALSTSLTWPHLRTSRSVRKSSFFNRRIFIFYWGVIEEFSFSIEESSLLYKNRKAGPLQRSTAALRCANMNFTFQMTSFAFLNSFLQKMLISAGVAVGVTRVIRQQLSRRWSEWTAMDG